MSRASMRNVARPCSLLVVVLAVLGAALRKELSPGHSQDKTAAVNKVITMLVDLHVKVGEEGEKEAASYNKFACFCKDTTSDKTEAIREGEDAKTSLTAKIGEGQSKRDELDTTIQTLVDDIEELEKDVKTKREERAKELKVYETNEADLSSAVSAIEGAIQAMHSSKPSLAQLRMVAKTAQTAALVAEASGLADKKSVRDLAALFLQDDKAAEPSNDNEVPMENYKFHSDSIIQTLEGLLKTFRDKKATLDEDEVKAVHEHNMYLQTKTDEIARKNTEMDDARKAKAETEEEIASDSEQLTTVSATLLDDQSYITELSQMCSDKATTWDTRSKVRADELTALTAAIAILKERVSAHVSDKTIRFAQRGASVRMAEGVVHDEAAMEALEADAEAEDGVPPSLLQYARRSLRQQPDQRGNGDGARAAVVDLLRDQGKQLQSSLLSSLATTIASDPLGKVKVLIEELIERLQAQSAAEATQKGWCDKSLSDAKQKRDHAAEAIAELNSGMAKLEAVRDKLSEEISVLAQEIKDMNAELEKANKMRADEKAENEATIAEAKDGVKAVQEAIKVLSEFYTTAKKGEVDASLAQVKGPKDDAPDAGFADNQAYKGQQGDAGGVLGMLAVIESDFERTVSETEKAEEHAVQDHAAFTTTTEASIAQKTEAKDAKTRQKDDASSKLSADQETMEAKSASLNGAIKELLELQPVCVNSGMSYEERADRRQDEIAALNKGLCILSNYAQYGPDSSVQMC